jgi:hypothetical protein
MYDSSARQLARKYINSRHNHAAWRLLASPRAPLIVGCLNTLFDGAQGGVAEEDALQALSDMLLAFATQDEFNIDADNTLQQAGRELREWIKRGLVIERGQRIYETDALRSAMHFVESLDNRIMTSTASRLSVVQQQIEQLETGINPDPSSRVATIKRKIKQLEYELEEAEAGNIQVLSEAQTTEALREVYALATGLSADFRRVEDSWREADIQLRQRVVAEGTHRGDILDRLLDGQEALLNTPEGRVFDGFFQQLRQSTRLEDMNHRLRVILSHPAARKALSRSQITDLKWLRLKLTQESRTVMAARSRSEQDVRSFIKTGLASEHHRVGVLLSDIFKQAQAIDWSSQTTRRLPMLLPPVAFQCANLSLIERLRYRSAGQEDATSLDFLEQEDNLDNIDDEFWSALDGLDREAVIEDTLALIAAKGKPMHLSQLLELLPPAHDLETLALWIGMAREANINIQEADIETFELTDEQQRRWEYTVPIVSLDQDTLADIEWDL